MQRVSLQYREETCVELIRVCEGAYFKPDETFTPSAVKAKWDQVGDFSKGSEYPVGMEGKDPHVSPGRVVLRCAGY